MSWEALQDWRDNWAKQEELVPKEKVQRKKRKKLSKKKDRSGRKTRGRVDKKVKEVRGNKNKVSEVKSFLEAVASKYGTLAQVQGKKGSKEKKKKKKKERRKKRRRLRRFSSSNVKEMVTLSRRKLKLLQGKTR